MNDLFLNISNANREKLLKVLKADTILFPKNTSISSVVKDVNIIGIIDYGSIQIIKNEYGGNRIILEDLSDHEIFGSITFPILNQEYDLITKEETKVTIIDYDQVLKNNDVKNHYYNQFIKNLLKIVSNKITEKNERIEILTKRSIRDKLLEYFRIVSKKNGARVIYLPFSFTELSDYLAIDRSAMSRELKYLKEEGFIKIDNRRITLLY